MQMPGPVRVVIEFESGEPIVGWVEREGGPRSHFEGMLHLISLIEKARLGSPFPSLVTHLEASPDP